MKNFIPDLTKIRNDIRRERISSWDRTGGNEDYIVIAPGQMQDIAHYSGSGCIRHIWMTMSSPSAHFAREVVLRMFWDGEEDASPSVEVPIGDFFGIGHGIVKNFWSLPLTMSPQDGRGFNCFFPLPFNTEFRISVENQSAHPLEFYFYVDFESTLHPQADIAYFHACWRRENPTDGWEKDRAVAWKGLQSVPNLSDQHNYLILDAEGKGHYVGCHLDIDCFQMEAVKWYGEGDDMFVIDGEPWPPRLHGTGTEDYFNTAYCPNQEFCTPFFGITVNSGDEDWKWKGKNSLYRFHITDPVYFEQSLRVSIEHGHANHQSNDYSSTAYWYQSEPHKKFSPLLPVKMRLPR